MHEEGTFSVLKMPVVGSVLGRVLLGQSAPVSVLLFSLPGLTLLRVRMGPHLLRYNRAGQGAALDQCRFFPGFPPLSLLGCMEQSRVP